MSGPAASENRALLRDIWPVVMGVLFAMIGLSLVAPILPLYAREFGVTRTEAGLLVAAFAVARLALDFAGGVVLDRMSARTLMRLGSVLIIVSSIAAALAHSFAILLVARLLEGAGSAAYAVAAQTWMIRRTPSQLMGRAMAWFQTGLTLGVIVGPMLGGMAAGLGDFTTPFWLYAVLGGLVFASTSFVSRVRPAPASEETRSSVRSLTRSPAFLVIMYVAFTLFVMRLGARSTLLPLFAREELALSEFDIGLVISVSGVVNLALVQVAGRAIDRYERGRVAAAGLALTAVMIATYAFADGLSHLIVISLIFGVGTSFSSVAAPTIAADLAPRGAEGRAIGLFRAAGDAGAIVGPVSLGAIADSAGFDAGFWATAALLASAAALSFALPGMRRPGTPGRGDPPPGSIV